MPGGYLKLRVMLLSCEWSGAADANGLRLATFKLTQEAITCDANALSAEPRASEVKVPQIVRFDYEDDGGLQDTCLLLLTTSESDIHGIAVARTPWSIHQGAELANEEVYERVGSWRAPWNTTGRGVLQRFREDASTVEIVLV